MADSPGVVIYTVGDVFPNIEDGRAAFAALKSLFATADVVFGNCEGVYSDRPAKSPSHKHFMGTGQDRGAFLAEVGFDVMSLANNHAIDGGYIGLSDTTALLTRQGIATTGAGRDLAEALTPAIVQRRGVRVAFLGVCSVFPKGYEARAARAGIAPLRLTTSYLDPDENFWEPGIEPDVLTTVVPDDLAQLEAAITAARASADVVIVAPHWGYSSRLELLHEYEIDLGRRTIEAGADAVVCAHHHSLRPVEFHRGRPIFYGLGALVHHFQEAAVTPEMRADRQRRFGQYSSMNLPEVEFPLWPFAEDSRKTMVAVLDVETAGHVVGAGFFPCQMVVDGSTELLAADDERARAISAYVEGMSRRAGFSIACEVTERNGWAFVEITEQ